MTISMKIVSLPRHTFLDYPDNAALATIIHFTGCSHNCDECYNPQLQNYDNTGFKIDHHALQLMIIKSVLDQGHNTCTKPKLVLSGGDPLYSENIKGIKNFLSEYGSDYDVCIYTGFDIAFVKTFNLTNFKFIKCGNLDVTKRCKAEKVDAYMQLASTNQDFYNHKYEKISTNGKLYFKD